LAGEGGMIMNTNPSNDDNPYGNAKAWQVGYFSECMSGFEHQVAAHMMAEGMAEESLILTRSIHDRYHAYKRNPFNEIECSDHYGRAMASHGTFISACGFSYHGPKGYIGFAPKIKPEHFKTPFTAAEGWGTYSQRRHGHAFEGKVQLKYGQLRVNKFTAELENAVKAANVLATLNDKPIPCRFVQTGTRCEIMFNAPASLTVDSVLALTIS
jgi:non-lysosomal glucosylceramidase